MGIAPAIKITLDRERSLRFDHNAYIAIEEMTGRVILIDGIDMRTIMSAKGIRDFLWAGLRHEDPDLTIEQVGAMLSFENMNVAIEAVAKALTESMPKAKEGGKRSPPPKASR